MGKFGDLGRGEWVRGWVSPGLSPGGASGYLGCASPRGAAGDPHERSIPGGCFRGESAPTSGCRNQERWYHPDGGAGVIKGARLHTMRGRDSPYLSSPRCEGPWGRGAGRGGVRWWVLQGWVRGLPPDLFLEKPLLANTEKQENYFRVWEIFEKGLNASPAAEAGWLLTVP